MSPKVAGAERRGRFLSPTAPAADADADAPPPLRLRASARADRSSSARLPPDDKSVFNKAIRHIRNGDFLDESKVAVLEELGQAVDELAERVKAVEAATGDVPDEFLEPLSGSALMLPSW